MVFSSINEHSHYDCVYISREVFHLVILGVGFSDTSLFLAKLSNRIAADSFSPDQKIPHSQVYCRIHKYLPLDITLRQVNPLHFNIIVIEAGGVAAVSSLVFWW